MMYLFYIGTAKALVFSCFCNIGFKFVAPKSATRRAFPGRRQTQMEMGGLDSDGRKFKNAEEMWREEVGDGDSQKKSQWYNKGIKYWQGVEATMDGVLGGYGHVNAADIKASEDFLNAILAERFPDAGRGRRLVALDCGSGIGRVTKNLLIRYFNEVDLLEPVLHFLESARVNLAPENLMVSELHKAANFYCVPLQYKASRQQSSTSSTACTMQPGNSFAYVTQSSSQEQWVLDSGASGASDHISCNKSSLSSLTTLLYSLFTLGDSLPAPTMSPAPVEHLLDDLPTGLCKAKTLVRPGWCRAMIEEMTALHDNGTWELVPFPKGKTVVGYRWVFTVKVGQMELSIISKRDWLLRDTLRFMALTMKILSHQLPRWLLFVSSYLWQQ
ncbi:Alpha N-terminal protein methyltransferase 1 [Capsicum chinense]|nr:Alpha N-terminal protein methyltransferase 1 [Capsicum chinense]